MKRALSIAGLTIVLLLALWSLLPAQVLNAITPYLLQTRHWVLSGGLEFPNAATKLLFKGAQQTSYTAIDGPLVADFEADFTTANPVTAPTITAQSAIGSCANGNQYKAYYSYVTPIGETLLSPASNEWNFTLSTGKMTMTRSDTPPPLATCWNSYWSKASEGHANKYKNGTCIPIGTTSQANGCSNNGSAPTTNTTGSAAIGTLRASSWRAAKYTAGPPGTLVDDVYRLDFDQNGLRQSIDSGANYYEIAPEGSQTRRVCQTCKYTTPQAAIDSITDASTSKRYTVYVAAGSALASATIPAYVSVVGESRFGTVLSAAYFAADSYEAAIGNLTVNGQVRLLGGGSRRRNYVIGCTLGQWPATEVDLPYDDVGNAPVDLFITDSEFHTIFDTHNFGQNLAFVGINNRYTCTGSSAECHYARLKAPFMSVQEFHSIVEFTQSGSYGGGATDVDSMINWEPEGSISSPQVTPLVRLYDVKFKMDITNTTRTDTRTACIYVQAASTYATPTVIDLRDFDCEITTASAGETINGIYLANDADLSNWAINWKGGKIALSGGTARNDLNNNLAGLTVTLDNVEHVGTYTGAGSVAVKHSPLTGSGVIRDDGQASKPASCRVGDTYIDNTGGAVALCLCTVSGTPGTWEAQGAGTCN